MLFQSHWQPILILQQFNKFVSLFVGKILPFAKQHLMLEKGDVIFSPLFMSCLCFTAFTVLGGIWHDSILSFLKNIELQYIIWPLNVSENHIKFHEQSVSKSQVRSRRPTQFYWAPQLSLVTGPQQVIANYMSCNIAYSDNWPISSSYSASSYFRYLQSVSLESSTALCLVLPGLSWI